MCYFHSTFKQHKKQVMASKAAKALTQAEKEQKSANFAALYEHWLENARNKKKTIDIRHLVHGKLLQHFINNNSNLFEPSTVSFFQNYHGLQLCCTIGRV